MTKNKVLNKIVLVLTLTIIIIGTVFLGLESSVKVKAEESQYSAETVLENVEGIEPRALFVRMTCQLIKNSEDNTVRAQASNEFTLFPGKVQTKVYLYSSETNTDDYTKMKLEASNYISDLDQGESISARVSLYGQRYWRARTLFLVDSGKEWQSLETETYYIPA